MSIRVSLLAAGLLPLLACSALAGKPPKPAPSITAGHSDKELHLIARAVQSQRIDGLRARSRFFSKITQQHDYKGERVVHRDATVTAFLDMSDPMHPRYDKEAGDEDESMASIPEARRAHILVVPNQPREHIAKSVTGVITLEDIDATRSVLEAAHKVADELGIKNARIYLNTSDRLTVGYLHVHITGERTASAAPYPDLKP